MNSESFAKVKFDDHELNSKSISYVPVAPREWSNNDSDTPESLKFVKARTALVPQAECVWGNPEEEAPIELKSNLIMVPVPAIIWTENITDTPEDLRLIKAKLATVPIPAKNWEDSGISTDEISLLR